MANPLAYLVRRKTRRYYVRFQRPDGGWSHKSLGTTKAAEAKLLFDEWKQDRLRARQYEAQSLTPVSLEQLAREHLRHVELHQAKSWLVKQRNYLDNYIVPFFGAKALTTDITPRQIRDYIDGRKERGKIRSVTANKELSCIKALFRFGEERGHVGENPARRVKLLRSDSVVHDRFLAYEDYLLLTEKAREEPDFVRSTRFNDCWSWIVLACNTGLRPGEQRVMEFADVDLEHGFLRVQSKPQIGFQVKNYQHSYFRCPPRCVLRCWPSGRRNIPPPISSSTGRTAPPGATSALPLRNW